LYLALCVAPPSTVCLPRSLAMALSVRGWHTADACVRAGADDFSPGGSYEESWEDESGEEPPESGDDVAPGAGAGGERDIERAARYGAGGGRGGRGRGRLWGRGEDGESAGGGGGSKAAAASAREVGALHPVPHALMPYTPCPIPSDCLRLVWGHACLS